MGKLLKYCSSCEEGFAERFGFCPNCGASLQAFEISPVAVGDVSQETPEIAVAALPEVEETQLDVKPIEVVEPAKPQFISVSPMVAKQETEADFQDTLEQLAAEPLDASVEMDELATAPAVAETFEAAENTVATPVYHQSQPVYADEPSTANPPIYTKGDDGAFHVTVIQEQNGKQRNILLLGATFLMLMVAFGATIFSLFQKDLDVGAIGDESPLASVYDLVPVPDEVIEKKNKDDGGGGGGGGRDEKEEVNQGDLANQTKNPVRPPDVKVPRLENPSLQLPPASTKGNQKFEQKYGQYGDPNKLGTKLSNGLGSGGGIGNGKGPGQGNGSGSGAGDGNGSGYGDGDGNGNGDGKGDGDDGVPPGIKKPVGITSPYKILLKPRAAYTDEARTNNVQGNVRLRITLLASGQVGSVSAVTRLPYGLTDKAIAAAKMIKFEPKKVNGVPITTTVSIDYGFTMY